MKKLEGYLREHIILKEFLISIKSDTLYEWFVWVKEIYNAKKNGFDKNLYSDDQILRYKYALGEEPMIITDDEGNEFRLFEDGVKVAIPTYYLDSVFPDKETNDKVIEYLRKQNHTKN